MDIYRARSYTYEYRPTWQGRAIQECRSEDSACSKTFRSFTLVRNHCHHGRGSTARMSRTQVQSTFSDFRCARVLSILLPMKYSKSINLSTKNRKSLKLKCGPWKCYHNCSLKASLLIQPVRGSPQSTTDPSSRTAANARSAAWIHCTFFSRPWTALLSAP